MYTMCQNLFWITTSGLELRPLQVRYPKRKKSTVFDDQLQKIGPIDLAKILHNVRGISPVQRSKIKMGVQAGVSELGGVEVAWGANFGAFAVHFVVYCAEVVYSIP